MTRRNRWLVLLSILGTLFQAPVARAVQGGSSIGTLLICGGPEVLEVTVRFDEDAATLLTRKDWRADRSSGLPAAVAPTFETTDECKPIDDGARVLVTSSGSGVAIIDRKSGKTLFHTTVPNAHSAEVLPHDRLVVAASVAPDGNRLMVFDRDGHNGAAAPPIASVPLESAHGVVWVASEQTLWALGRSELQAYELGQWETDTPSLTRRETFRLPSNGGHDLSSLPDSSIFMVTTDTQVLTFDRKTRQFSPHEPLAKLANVKSVSVDPVTSRIVYIQADSPEWWSRTMRVLSGRGLDKALMVSFPNDRLYKARWLR